MKFHFSSLYLSALTLMLPSYFLVSKTSNKDIFVLFYFTLHPAVYANGFLVLKTWDFCFDPAGIFILFCL